MKKASLLLLVLLGGCAFEPHDTGSGFMFALPPAQIQSAADPAAAGDSLVVFTPTTSPELDTYRIALNSSGTRWDYYAGARWSDFLPLLVQDDITKTLEQTHLFKVVATGDSGLTGDRILKTEIRAFQADYTARHAAPTVRIRLRFSLVSRRERKPLSSFNVAVEKQAKADNLSAIQAAFSAAFDDVQQQLVANMKEMSK